MNSVHAFIDAIEAVGLRLAAVHWGWLAAGIGFTLLNLVLRSRAWQGILRAALPQSTIRYRTAFGAYCAGVGVNAIIPARVGDLVKMFLVRRSVPEAGYPVLVGTLVCETLVDLVLSTGLLVWALYAGVLPGLRLPDIPAFDMSLALRHPWWTALVVAAILVALALVGRRVRSFWREFGRGFAVIRTPWRYLRSVVSYQVAGWFCRIAAGACFLSAFGIPVTLQAALVVQVASGLGGLFPATPGGLGPKQALLVVMLAGSAGRTDVLAFSAGMELAIIVTNAALGLACLALMVRHLRFRQAIAQARSDRDAAPEG